MSEVRVRSRLRAAFGSRLLTTAMAVLATGLASTVSAEPLNLDGLRIVSISTGWGGEGTYVNTQGAVPSSVNCGQGNRFILSNDHPMQKEMVSMLLMALQNKQVVHLRVDGCNSGTFTLKAITLNAP